ncbi:hypothetical protein NM688_g1480 [Phlebia brevispora]|uniref:Uncharacterized protein n=1 Tax=Phlebia brevispora TaxID=194682 RepID=A0ACC1TBD2_9APHY|nr:hypothetical protein NM688_g1480 [Phlebia brevispora]
MRRDAQAQMSTTSSTREDSEVEDLFSDSLQSLYGYAPLTCSSAGSIFQYHLQEDHLRWQSVTRQGLLRLTKGEATSETDAIITLVTPMTESKNWSLHASSIWTSSLFLADHLRDLQIDQHIQAVKESGHANLRILELGTGAGLPSILIARCFDGVEVIASDYPDAKLIATLQSNVDTNVVATKCCVVPYAWGNDTSVFKRQTADPEETQDEHLMDVIIAADTLWDPEFHPTLLRTLQMLLRRSTDARVHLVAAIHTGRYTLQALIDSIDDYGLELEAALERHTSGDGEREWNADRAEQERRQWLIWMKIKWKRVP